MENTCGFVHLHNHTMYSLLDGAIRPGELIAAAKDWGMGAIALTDHGAMFGAVEFFLKAKAAGIKPIIGSEVYVAIEGMTVKRAARGNNDGANHLVLLAATDQGYRNLMKIVSLGYLDGFYYKPRVDKAVLREYHEGIIALSACIGGEIPQLILQGHPEEAEKAALEYVDIFGEDNFYLEIQNHGIPEEKTAYAGVIDLARRTGIGLVATNDAHYLKPEHAESHDILLCIATGKTVDDPNRMKMSVDTLYLRTPDEMRELFADTPDALENTVRIAERCDVTIKTGEYNTVRFKIPDDFDGNADEYLTVIAHEGLVTRYGGDAPTHTGRLEYELGVIQKMGFSDYFLAIYDCTRAAREMGIPVGTARGSAGGSIVAYAIGITNLDPMRFDLIFERFLNPERVSMPDFDVDYADRYRERMIEYVKQKYGADHVCQIITFGSMKARLVLRDVGRVLNIPYGDVDMVAKLIPTDLNTTLESALDQVKELSDLVRKNEVYARLFKHARVLEGLNRHAGTHAAGIIITPGPCTDYLPLYRPSSDSTDITSQFEMEYVEKIGCLKVDFLGLRTLTVIRDAVDIITDRGTDVDIDDLPLDDPAVYDLMSRGDTIGIFQFESSGMRDYLRKLRPTCIEDLIAMNALYRPGPLGSNMVDDFIRRKHGEIPITYPHPLLEPILKETYGVIVYQEQVMKIANVMAGFTLGGADQLRRAMGKKKVDVMAKMKHEFVEGAKAKDISAKIAGEVFDLMAHFAGYGFNKSHSAGYAILAYQTAWLKAHHPAEFMAANLTSEMDDTSRIVVLIEECRHMGIDVLPPDVNRSDLAFTVEDANIRFGLAAVKNVGRGPIENFVAARTEGGIYHDLFDFCDRVDLRSLNKRMMESLVMAGAMDSFDAPRECLAAGIDQAVESAQRTQAERDAGQCNLFGEAADDEPGLAPQTLPVAPPWTTMERLAKEKSVLGFWFSGHPLDGYREELTAFATPFASLLTCSNDSKVTVGGVITTLERRTTKAKNKPYIRLRVEDSDGSGEVLLMNGAFDAYKDSIAVDDLVLISGSTKGQGNGDQPTIFADVLESLPAARMARTRAVTIALGTGEATPDRMERIAAACTAHPGTVPFWLRLDTQTSGSYRVRTRRFQVSPDPALLKDLRTILGADRVWIG